MRHFVLIWAEVLLAALPLAAVPLHAQSFSSHSCPDGDGGGDNSFLSRWLGGSEHVCELRTVVFPLVNGQLNVNGTNGGIEVVGEDRRDVYLEARVIAHAGSKSAAEALLHEISIQTGETVQANGPTAALTRSWSVSFKLHVPHELTGDFHTMNGGLTLVAIEGDIHGDTTNGGLEFKDLGGNVRLTTTNGAIRATLAGKTWQGVGLTAKTTNGGISVDAAPGYSAHVTASTVNGSIEVAGQTGSRHHSVDMNIGSGGPTLDFETTNGGISIR
ncbi:MAG: hypothetical protein ACLGQX_03995 [Acidobacteriota bacterium]